MTMKIRVQLPQNMKLLLMFWSLHVSLTNANDILQQLTEQAMSPTEFQPQPPINPFILDSQLYLPPEAQTQQPIPFFSSSPEPQIKYLPPTAIKIPNPYPQPFENYNNFNPATLHFGPEKNPNFEDNTTEISSKLTKDHNNYTNLNRNSPGPQHQYEKNEHHSKFRSLQIMNEPNYKNRKDYSTKLPIHQSYQNPVINIAPFNFNRRTLSQQVPQQFQHNHMNDLIPDQFKMASSTSQQFASPPQHYQGPPTEAVPILRQSSEMDLDGSFHYETLTGDQTHVIQHGHMENAGTENEEQVVEGSYSFVGDDGQTYTVHYVADGNGFRATGDHLPVAPPIPEIIQRSIQYNINEEAHRPQPQYGYQDGDNNILQRNQHAPSPRNYFQSRPEAFTRSLQAMSTENPVAQASNNYQQVIKNLTPKNFVQPQVNYAASQGAYIPVSNTVQPTARSYVPPPTETPKTYAPSQNVQTQTGRHYAMSPHTDGEASSNSLQYQRMLMPAGEFQNGRSHTTLNKNGISRSSTDVEDEVLINFNEMTPDQYAQIYQSQIAPRSIETTDKIDVNTISERNNKSSGEIISDKNTKSISQSQIITGKSYLPPSQTVTSSYNYMPRNYDDKRYQTNTKISQNHIPQNQIIKSANDVRPIDIHTRNSVLSYETHDTRKDFPSESYHYKQPYDDIITADNLAMESYTVPKLVKAPTYVKPEPNYFLKSQHNYIQPSSVLPTRNYILNQLSEVLTPPLVSPNNMYHEDNLKYAIKNITASQDSYYNIHNTNNNGNYIRHNDILGTKQHEKPDLNLVLRQENKQNKHALASDTKPLSTEKQGKSQKIESNKNMILDNPEKSYVSNQQNEMDESSVDLSHILNLVNMKNYFESSRITPKTNQQLKTPSINKQIRNIVLQKPNNYREENKAIDSKIVESHLTYFENPDSTNTQKYSTYISKPNRADKNRQNGERVYKTLQRNINTDPQKDVNIPFVQNPIMIPFEQVNSDLNKKESLRFSQTLPPLGRAGPSNKAYIPPQAPMFS